MKKIILITLITILAIFSFGIANAGDNSNTVKIRVTEYIPWANCEKVSWTWQDKDWSSKDQFWNEIPTLYDCKVPKPANLIYWMLWAILKYFTYIAALAWVCFIVFNWIMYSMWWVDEQAKTKAKERIVMTIIWLILLFLAWPLLQLVAPWVYN